MMISANFSSNTAGQGGAIYNTGDALKIDI